MRNHYISKIKNDNIPNKRNIIRGQKVDLYFWNLSKLDGIQRLPLLCDFSFIVRSDWALYFTCLNPKMSGISSTILDTLEFLTDHILSSIDYTRCQKQWVWWGVNMTPLHTTESTSINNHFCTRSAHWFLYYKVVLQDISWVSFNPQWGRSDPSHPKYTIISCYSVHPFDFLSLIIYMISSKNPFQPSKHIYNGIRMHYLLHWNNYTAFNYCSCRLLWIFLHIPNMRLQYSWWTMMISNFCNIELIPTITLSVGITVIKEMATLATYDKS